MRLNVEDARKISLSKKKYTVIYPCCDVLAFGLESTLCWVCGGNNGISFHDIPLTRHDLIPQHSSYRQGTSTIYMQASKVTEEALKWPHP